MLTIIKQLLTLGIPLAASRFMHTLNTFIVMLFIAQLGHDALAASFTMATTRIIIMPATSHAMKHVCLILHPHIIS